MIVALCRTHTHTHAHAHAHKHAHTHTHRMCFMGLPCARWSRGLRRHTARRPAALPHTSSLSDRRPASSPRTDGVLRTPRGPLLPSSLCNQRPLCSSHCSRLSQRSKVGCIKCSLWVFRSCDSLTVLLSLFVCLIDRHSLPHTLLNASFPNRETPLMSLVKWEETIRKEKPPPNHTLTPAQFGLLPKNFIFGEDLLFFLFYPDLFFVLHTQLG